MFLIGLWVKFIYFLNWRYLIVEVVLVLLWKYVVIMNFWNKIWIGLFKVMIFINFNVVV